MTENFTDTFEKLTYIENPIKHDNIDKTYYVNSSPYNLCHSYSLKNHSLADLKAILDFLDSSHFRLTHENVEQNRERILLVKEEIENRLNLIFA